MFAFKQAQLTSFLWWKIELECFVDILKVKMYVWEMLNRKLFQDTSDRLHTSIYFKKNLTKNFHKHAKKLFKKFRDSNLRISTCLRHLSVAISIIAIQLKPKAAWNWLWHEIYLFCEEKRVLCRSHDTCRYWAWDWVLPLNCMTFKTYLFFIYWVRIVNEMSEVRNEKVNALWMIWNKFLAF